MSSAGETKDASDLQCCGEELPAHGAEQEHVERSPNDVGPVAGVTGQPRPPAGLFEGDVSCYFFMHTAPCLLIRTADMSSACSAVWAFHTWTWWSVHVGSFCKLAMVPFACIW